ncbi:amino acid permease [Streptomyces albidoflavus]
MAALCLLVLVLAVRLGEVRAGTGLQLVLVAVLVTLVVVAVAGAAPGARAAHWTPFAPDGWAGVARAASPLMLAFVGWEAVAPLTARLRDPRRQLPRVVGTAFAVTALLYLGLAVATVAVLGPRAGGPVPLTGAVRLAAGVACAVVALLPAGSGWAALVAAGVAVVAGTRGRPDPRPEFDHAPLRVGTTRKPGGPNRSTPAPLRMFADNPSPGRDIRA